MSVDVDTQPSWVLDTLVGASDHAPNLASTIRAYMAARKADPINFTKQRHSPVGKWINRMRIAYAQGKLAPEVIAILECLDGWSWSAHDATWRLHREALGRWKAQQVDEDAWPTKSVTVPASGGHAGDTTLLLGSWWREQRRRLLAGGLSITRLESLRQLPGFVALEPSADLSLEVKESVDVADTLVVRHGDLAATNRYQIKAVLESMPCARCGGTDRAKRVLGTYGPRETAFSALVSSGNWAAIAQHANEAVDAGAVVCRGCAADARRAAKDPAHTETHRTCMGECGQLKPVTEFRFRDKKTGRRRSDCRTCARKAVTKSIAKRKADIERRRAGAALLRDPEWLSAAVASGNTIAQIASIVGHSSTTVRRALLRAGVPAPARKSKLPADPSEVQAHFDAGLTKAQVARDLGISPSTLANYVRRHGLNGPDAELVRQRRLSQHPIGGDPAICAEIIRRYEAGEGLKPLASIFDVNRTIIRRILERDEQIARRVGTSPAAGSEPDAGKPADPPTNPQEQRP